MPNDPPLNHSQDLSSRVTALEELVTYQEQTIEALNSVVLELGESVEQLAEKLARVQEVARGAAESNAGGERGLPLRPGRDPEAPPHY